MFSFGPMKRKALPTNFSCSSYLVMEIKGVEEFFTISNPFIPIRLNYYAECAVETEIGKIKA